MKKYFMKGTDEEIKFGDMLELDCSKDMEDGHICHHHLECKFIPELVDTLIEEEIIEAKGEDLIDFVDDGCSQIEKLVNMYNTLEEKIDELHSDLNQIKSLILLTHKKPSKDAKKPEGK